MPAVSERISSAAKTSHQVFLLDVLEGLSAAPRSLPSKYFYDVVGSQLFDRICELDEYYPTRVETAIMLESAEEMADRLGADLRLVEYGSGSSVKTRLLLDHLIDPAIYSPVDISAEHLTRVAAELSSDYPLLNVAPIAADFTQPFDLPDAEYGAARTCIYFPGSTIGNFTPDQAAGLLRRAGDRLASGDAMLIGFDLQKDIAVIEAAYNDAAGITAAFNKNVLHRINVELGGNFDLGQFQHRAFYNQCADRIEMHLVSNRHQCVAIGDQRFQFVQGESICTEYSHKYTLEGFAQLAESTGWRRQAVWTDSQDLFAVMYLEK